jgi:hypothetical protein
VHPALSPEQGHEGHPEPPNRLQVDPGVAGARGTDEVVQRNVVGTGKRQQQLQGRPALPALQPGQRALRFGELACGGPPLLAHRMGQPVIDGREVGHLEHMAA